jgi:L,D-transpeptidase YcbB
LVRELIGASARLSAVLFLLGACAGRPIPAAEPLLSPEEDRRELVQSVRQRFAELFCARVAEAEPIVAALKRGLAPTLREAELLAAAYGKTPRLRFVDGDRARPSAAGAALLKELSTAPDQGLTGPYPEPEVRRMLQRDAPASGCRAPAVPTVEEMTRVSSVRGSGTAAERRLVELLVSPGSPVPGLAQAYARACADRRDRLDRAARLELLLADALVRYARALGRTNAPPAPAPQAAGARRGKRPKPPSSAPSTAVARALLLRDLESVHDPATLRAVLAALPPPSPQYARLVGALRHYRAMVAAGGWSEVPARPGLRRGSKHPVVEALKRRLAAEGLYRVEAGKEIDARFDDALVEAVRAYQSTHQIPVTGRPERLFWRSLAISARRRAQAIEVTLQRWRESAVGRAPYYALVNVPDFHLEIWRGGKQLQRQRIVVGKSSGEKCDEETERKVPAYATPLQTALIKTLVFSPFWNVTRYIKETELDPERAKDPLYYEKHGYEVMQTGTRTEWVRELPGPANSLGFVKFLFPNPHETYLHDTPQKALFEHPVRAFSHGCMRVQDPWGLAKLLLSEDGQWQEEHYRRLQRTWQSMNFEPLRKQWDAEVYKQLRERATTLEQMVNLRRPVAIHVEYFTVRVDDEGRVHFLSDVYRLDQLRLQPRLAARCVPETKAAKRRFSLIPSRLEALEKQGKELLPRLEEAQQAGRRLDAATSWEVRRTLKQLKELEKFVEHHRNLAQRIRDDHEALADSLEEARWGKQLVDRAVRLERLLTALDAMNRTAATVSARAIKMAPPAK